MADNVRTLATVPGVIDGHFVIDGNERVDEEFRAMVEKRAREMTNSLVLRAFGGDFINFNGEKIIQ